jgi:hypothetical protein
MVACGDGVEPAAVTTTSTAQPAVTSVTSVTSPGGILPDDTVVDTAVDGIPADQTPTVANTLPADATPTPPADATPTPPPAEVALQISGAPKTEAKVDEAYTFIPGSNGPDGDIRSFSVTNLPGWLNFKTATGELSGTPTAAETGVYPDVTIQVDAGSAYETLAPFDIEVVTTGMEAITLSWAAPTQNDDGSVLTDLAGFRIRYGETSGEYSTVISLTNPGLASYYIEGLVPSTYYFVISAYNSEGTESNYSNEVFKTI